jgi:hypothetical protein
MGDFADKHFYFQRLTGPLARGPGGDLRTSPGAKVEKWHDDSKNDVAHAEGLRSILGILFIDVKRNRPCAIDTRVPQVEPMSICRMKSMTGLW